MTYDALIIGGSFAGLAAATYIARGRRTVAVIDAGSPRNRFATHAHGMLTRDGTPPLEILEQARAQVGQYANVDFITGTALTAASTADAFRVTLDSGRELNARRLVLAFGIHDELPQLPGLADRWGESVLHCPYCHGYEIAGQRLGVLYQSPVSLHQARLIPEWGPTLLFLDGAPMPDTDTLTDLTRRGVLIEPAPLAALLGEGRRLSAVRLQDGRDIPLDALYIGPRNHFNSDIAERLGCALGDTPLGRRIQVDATQQTSVPGVFAAGDITRVAHSVTWAMADGVSAGGGVHASLVFGG